MGRPPARGLASVTTSGSTPNCLKGKPVSSASEPALDLVGKQQGAGGIAELPSSGKELLRDGMNAALTLNRFDADGADILGKQVAQMIDIIEADEINVRHNWGKGLPILELVGGCHRADGSTMKAVFQSQKTAAQWLASFGGQGGVRSSDLECSLPSLRSGVAKEDTIETADLSQAESEGSSVLVKKQVRGMQQTGSLACYGYIDCRVAISEGADTNPTQEIKIFPTLIIDQMNPSALNKELRISLVGLHQQFFFGGL